MATFTFELVSPERVLLSESAEHVVLPGLEGDLGVLPGHAPVIAMLRPGLMEVHLPSGRRRVFVKGGFAEIEPDRLTVLAVQAFDVADPGAQQIVQREIGVAEAELAAATSDDARFIAQEALDRLRSLSAPRA